MCGRFSGAFLNDLPGVRGPAYDGLKRCWLGKKLLVGSPPSPPPSTNRPMTKVSHQRAVGRGRGVPELLVAGLDTPPPTLGGGALRRTLELTWGGGEMARSGVKRNG